MKLSRILEASQGGPSEPIVAPSDIHVRFVKLLGELSRLGNQTGHPAAKLMGRLLPSMLRDIVEVPPETLAKICRQISLALAAVADDELGQELPAELIVGEGGADDIRPALAALAEGSRG